MRKYQSIRIGNDGFKQLEEDVNASIDVNKSVIARKVDTFFCKNFSHLCEATGLVLQKNGKLFCYARAEGGWRWDFPCGMEIMCLTGPVACGGPRAGRPCWNGYPYCPLQRQNSIPEDPLPESQLLSAA